MTQAPSPYRLIHFARVGITSVMLTGLLWPILDWKGLLTALPLWIGFETIFRIRIRAELVCDQCGFDPTLYLSDIPRARREVDDFWKKKFGERPVATQSPLSDQDALSREEVESERETLLDRR